LNQFGAKIQKLKNNSENKKKIRKEENKIKIEKGH
jgi:hypothetical protein